MVVPQTQPSGSSSTSGHQSSGSKPSLTDGKSSSDLKRAADERDPDASHVKKVNYITHICDIFKHSSLKK